MNIDPNIIISILHNFCLVLSSAVLDPTIGQWPQCHTMNCRTNSSIASDLPLIYYFCLGSTVHVAISSISDVNKTFFVKTKTKTKTLDLKTKTKTETFFQDQDQDQDFTRTTEHYVTISWSQNEQNSIHTTRIAVYEIKTVGLM